jgi:hypothetical protein
MMVVAAADGRNGRSGPTTTLLSRGRHVHVSQHI